MQIARSSYFYVQILKEYHLLRIYSNLNGDKRILPLFQSIVKLLNCYSYVDFQKFIQIKNQVYCHSI